MSDALAETEGWLSVKPDLTIPENCVYVRVAGKDIMPPCCKSSIQALSGCSINVKLGTVVELISTPTEIKNSANQVSYVFKEFGTSGRVAVSDPCPATMKQGRGSLTITATPSFCAAKYGPRWPSQLTASYRVKAQNLSSTSNRLEWYTNLPSDGAFRIERSDNNREWIALEMIGAVTPYLSYFQFIDYAVKPKTFYYYRVVSVTRDGEAETNSVGIESYPVLEAPKVSLAASKGKMTIAWKAFNVGTLFEIQESNNGGTFSSGRRVGADKKVFVTTNVKSGVNYCYRVREVRSLPKYDASPVKEETSPFAAPVCAKAL